MTHETDYPHTRRALVCPLCHCEKAPGLLVCWPCYRAHGLAYVGLEPYVLASLETAEAAHLAQEARAAAIVAGMGSPARSHAVHSPAIVAAVAALLSITPADAGALVTDAAVYASGLLWFVLALALYRYAFGNPADHTRS